MDEYEVNLIFIFILKIGSYLNVRNVNSNNIKKPDYVLVHKEDKYSHRITQTYPAPSNFNKYLFVFIIKKYLIVIVKKRKKLDSYKKEGLMSQL